MSDNIINTNSTSKDAEPWLIHLDVNGFKAGRGGSNCCQLQPKADYPVMLKASRTLVQEPLTLGTVAKADPVEEGLPVAYTKPSWFWHMR